MSRQKKTVVKLSPQRIAIINALKTKFSPAKAKAYEKAIHQMCQDLSKEVYEESPEEIYEYYAYEKTGQLIACQSDDIKEVLNDLQEGRVGSAAFYYRQIFKVDDSASGEPLIRTGVFPCRKKDCRAFQTKETLFRAEQRRSGDEGMTIIISCRVCGEEYTIN